MGTLRAGVAGVGHLGYHHARIYAAMKNVELVGVADPHPEHRDRASTDFGTPGFADLEGLIAAKPDIVSVVTPTEGHHAATMRLLAAGAHVLVEKPIAATSAQAEEMVAAARDTGRLLQVGHIERFNAAVQALFEGIHTPRFIECHRLSPYPNRNNDVSVVHDLMIHDLDIVLCLAQSEVVSVDAVGVPVFSSCEDIANARLRFASGCVANLTSSRVSLEGMRKIRIFEDNAYVSTDYSAQQVLVYRKKPGPVPEGENPMASITVDPLPVTREEPLLRELQAFVRAVTLGENPAVTGEDGLRALRLVEDIVEQIRSHR